jgi:hypothetical protein
MKDGWIMDGYQLWVDGGSIMYEWIMDEYHESSTDRWIMDEI